MRAMARASNTVVPILVVMLMLILDFSVGASAIIPSEDGSNQITEERIIIQILKQLMKSRN